MGKIWASQDIKRAIAEGQILPTVPDSRVDSNTFDPVITDELFILDTEQQGLFRPRPGQQVYQALLKELPNRSRQKVKINQGYELKRGFTYLIPLDERVRVGRGQVLSASPKSSMGRLFLNTRMLADGSGK